MCSGRGNWTCLQLGFPIRKSPDHSSVANFPGLIAGSYVLHRLLVPRHPPCALSSLSCYKDARVHCVVLKLRAVPTPGPRLIDHVDDVAEQFEGVQAQKNRITRSLRTQQCAWRAPTVGARGSTLAASTRGEARVAVLTSSSHESRPNSRRSTSEQCRPVNGCHRNLRPGQLPRKGLPV